MVLRLKFNNAAGARIVEALTSGIYDGNSNCIREYIQNSVDSGATVIKIDHLNNESDIRIRDNGSGMSREELENALQFGYSNKSGSDVGWRGIGAYSGVPNFRKIHINSKKKGSQTKIHITIHCDKIRDGYLLKGTLNEILETGIPDEIEEVEDVGFEDGTEILLSEIEVGQKIFFAKERLKGELIKVLPLPMKDNEFKSKILDHLAKSGISEPTFKIYYNNEVLYRPPFDSKLFDSESLCFGIEKAKDGTDLFAYWVLTSSKKKELKDPHRGLLFKKKHFTIGDNTTFSRLIEGSYSYWNYGEIHILDGEILENAARNFFEINTGHTNEFLTIVENFISDMQRNNRKKSAKDKKDDLQRLAENAENGKIKLAEKKLKEISSSVGGTITGASKIQGLKHYSQILDNRAREVLDLINTVKESVQNKKTDYTEQEFQSLLEKLKPEIKKMAQNKVRDIHRKVNFRHVMDKIEDELRTKTGSTKSEFLELLKEVFKINEGADINEVKRGCQLFLIDPNEFKKPIDIKYSYYLTTEFAHLLNALYQLLVNGEKHHVDKLGDLLFKDKTKTEIAAFYLDLQHTINFCERLVKLTKKRSEIGSLP